MKKPKITPIGMLDEFELHKDGENPLNTLRAICLAIDVGVNPPESAMKWLSAGIRSYLVSDGENRFDELLGLSVGKGQTPWAKQEVMDTRDSVLFLYIDSLIYLGATLEHAAEIVSRFSERYVGFWPYDSHRVKALSTETLIDRYKKAKRDGISEDQAQRYGLKDHAVIIRFLNRFDLDLMRLDDGLMRWINRV